MNCDSNPRPSNLTPADLRGVGACLRKIYTVANDRSFDCLLGQLDRAAGTSGTGGRRS